MMLRAVVVAVVWLWAQMAAAQLIDVNVGGVPILQRQDVAMTAGDCLVVDSGGLTVSGGACAGGGSGDVTAVGPGCASGACFTDGVVTSGTSLLIWEGTSSDTSEFTLSVPANPSADITWSVPDAATVLTFPSGTRTLATLDGSETLASKTLTAPTIADFSNATHAHTAASSGGTLDVAAIGSGTLGVSRGGTGIGTYAQGDVLYASGTSTLAALAKNASSTRYLSNTGASNNPAWAQVALTTGVSGTLPVGNGGTGQTATTEDATLVANGSVFVATVLPSCSDATTSKLLYNSTSNAFSCGTDQTSGGGGGAPTTATYVTLSTDGTLSNERVLTAGTAIDVSDAGAGSTVTVDWDSTEVGTTTWGSGSGIVWTYNASAGTDPAITFGNGTVDVSTGTLQQGGTAVALQSVDLTAGAGLSGGGTISTNRTFATDSTEASFISTSAITCGGTGADAGKINVGAIASYCDSGGALEYVARAESDGGANYLRNSTDCSLVVTEAGPCWDSDDNLLSVGDSATRKTMVDLSTAQTLANKTVDDSTSATSGSDYGLQATMTGTATSGTTVIYGLSGSAVSSPASGTFATARGVNAAATADDAGVTTEATGVYGSVAKTGTGVVTTAYGVRAGIANLNASGAITTSYGVYVDDSFNSGGGLTTEYALYTAGSEQSRLGGSLGVGGVDPSAVIHALGSASGSEVLRLQNTTTGEDPVTKTVQYRGVTSGAASVTFDYATTSNRSYFMDVKITALCTAGAGCTAGQVGGWIRRSLYRNVAGTLTEVNETAEYGQDDITGAITAPAVAVSGTNIRLTCTGLANQDITWHVNWTLHEVGA